MRISGGGGRQSMNAGRSFCSAFLFHTRGEKARRAADPSPAGLDFKRRRRLRPGHVIPGLAILTIEAGPAEHSAATPRPARVGDVVAEVHCAKADRMLTPHTKASHFGSCKFLAWPSGQMAARERKCTNTSVRIRGRRLEARLAANFITPLPVLTPGVIGPTVPVRQQYIEFKLRGAPADVQVSDLQFHANDGLISLRSGNRIVLPVKSTPSVPTKAAAHWPPSITLSRTTSPAASCFTPGGRK